MPKTTLLLAELTTLYPHPLWLRPEETSPEGLMLGGVGTVCQNLIKAGGREGLPESLLGDRKADAEQPGR